MKRRLYTVCHNETEGATRWVHYYQNPENEGFQRKIDRPEFTAGGFYQGLSMNRLYTRSMQRRTISTILGSDILAGELIKPSGDLFLSRGHMAARSDFIFLNHQRATFYFVNAAPQWQTFNGGNWAILEDHFKRYVARKNINTEIYTGTHGIVTYKDVNGVQQKIYLSSTNDSQKVPVPKIYYKLIIDTRNKAGIVFIGVNNPYASEEEIQKDYVYCRNVMDKVNYIPWYKNKLSMGYLYACSVKEFAKAIGDLPHLPATDSLLL